jgi:DNA-binding transcriptional LysR family regulator
MQMTLAQLHAFVSVVERGGFSAAANDLVMTQPAVSHAIKTLEQVLGGPLLHRHPLITPTALGHTLLPHARSTIASAQSLLIASKSHFGQSSGTVRLAASTTACLGLVPHLFRHWRHHLPDIAIHLLEGHDDEMVQWLEEGVVDAAILADPPSRSVGSIAIAKDSFHAIVHRDHALARSSQIEVRELINEPLLVCASGCLHQVVDMCTEENVNFLPAQEVRELGTLISMVAGKIGVSIVPSLAQNMLPKELIMVPLDRRIERNLILTGPEGRPWNPFVTSLIENIRAAPFVGCDY